MTSKLKELVNLRAGYSFRGRIEANDSGDCYAVQLKDIDLDQGICLEGLIKTELPGRAPSLYLEDGDIAFVARGSKNYAVCAKNIIEPTVLSQHFLQMRVHDTNYLLPEYLTWYLNNANSAKKYFRKTLQGTALPTITRSFLDDMEIELPALEIQKKIIDLQRIHLREKSLLNQLLENNSNVFCGLSNKLLNEASK